MNNYLVLNNLNNTAKLQLIKKRKNRIVTNNSDVKHSIYIISLIFILQGCTIKYSFTGISISENVKTFSVEYFPNRARLVNPNLSQFFTEAIQDRITRQTRLNMVTEGGDIEYSGQITGYETRPMNIQQGDVAAQTRLTITVNVKFVDNTNSENDWEKSFSAFADFSSTSILSDVEDTLMDEIVEKLVEDILNASLAKWD